MKIKVWISIPSISEHIETEIDLPDDSTQEEIEQAAKDAAFEFIEWGYSEKGEI